MDCEGDGRGFPILNYRDVTMSQAPAVVVGASQPLCLPSNGVELELKQTPLSCVCWDFIPAVPAVAQTPCLSACVCSACLSSRTVHCLSVVTEPNTRVCEIRASAEPIYSYVLISRVRALCMFPRKPVCQEVLKYLSSELCGRHMETAALGHNLCPLWSALMSRILLLPFS